MGVDMVHACRAFLACLAAALPLAAQLPTQLVPVQGVRAHVFDAQRGIVCLATDTGLLRWNVVTQSFLPPVLSGFSLRGMDLTVDGNTLLAGSAGLSGGQLQLHRVDLATGQVATVLVPAQPGETTVWDVVALANGRALFTTLSSSFAPVRELRLADNTVTVRTDYPNAVLQLTTPVNVARSADGSRAWFAVANDSAGPMFAYDATTDAFPVARNFNTFLFSSMVSLSRNGVRGAVEIAGGSAILNGTLANVSFAVGMDSGHCFDPTRDRMYAPSTSGNVIRVLDTTFFQVTDTFPVGEPVPVSQPQSTGEMSMAADGSWLCYTTASGVRLYRVGLPTPLVESIEPPHAHWDAGSVAVTVRGRFFDASAGSNPQVRIGGLPATDVVVVDGQTVTCRAPADTARGPKRVEVQFTGRAGVLDGAFARTPAISFVGPVAIGQPLVFRTQLRPGDWVGGFFSWPPRTAGAVPGATGTLWLLQPTPWFVLPAWPLNEVVLTTTVPNDPGLVGFGLVFQSMTFGPANDLVLSNDVGIGF